MIVPVGSLSSVMVVDDYRDVELGGAGGGTSGGAASQPGEEAAAPATGGGVVAAGAAIGALVALRAILSLLRGR